MALPEDLVPPGYIKSQVMSLMDLDARGRLRNTVPMVVVQGRRRRGKEMAIPNIRGTRRTSAIVARLLADRADYALGLCSEGADEKARQKVTQRHREFIKLIRECAAKTTEPDVEAVLRFLEALTDQERDKLRSEGFASRDVVTFRVDGRFPTELPRVRQFWAERSTGLEQIEGECLVCGRWGPIARVHEVPIKLPADTALVSVNKEAFESYGLTQAYNAPVCQKCAENYAKGLNRLLRGNDTSLRVEQVAYTFWTREPQRFSVAQLLAKPQPEEVRALLESPWKAKEAAPLRANDFYAFALSSNKGRAVVRDWIESTLPEVQENLRRYFLRQRIVPLCGEEPRFFPIRDLVRSLAPDRLRRGRAESREPPQAATILIHSALTGMPPPDWMLFLAARRNHAEQGPITLNQQGGVVSWARAALIKLLLQSQTRDIEPNEEGKMDTTTQQSPAYLCGRLLALLEQAQSAAIPRPKATLVDRFYGSASSAPASVFGLLLRNAQPHLAKLRKENLGAHINIQKGLEEVLSQVGQQFPRVLTLREQAVFALGYYYQRAARWTRQVTPEASAPEPEKAQEPER